MAKGTSGVFGTISMIVAFLAIGGFMYWLSLASEPTEFAVADEGEQAQVLSLAAFQMNPAGFEEVLLELDGVVVSETLGSQAFVTELPNGELYLVRIPGALVQQGLAVRAGDRGRITGRVQLMSEEVLARWDSEGVFVDPEHRAMAGMVPTFFNVESVQLETPAAEPAGDDQEVAVPEQG
jgi:translation initiation factor IF-1